MQEITFITGNQKKADYLAKYLGFPVRHMKLDLDEIQSLDLKKIVEHKVRQAYEKIKSPVIVEDVSLAFEALGGLPGPFIKFFLENMSEADICSLVDGKSRRALVKSAYAYYDGKRLEIFEGMLPGEIAKEPAGDNGFGWDRIFIAEGYTVTRASLDAENDRRTYLKIKQLEKLKVFFESLA